MDQIGIAMSEGFNNTYQAVENYTYQAKLADTKSGQLHMTSNTTYQGAFA